MLSLVFTALAQGSGNESGTNQTVAPIEKADIRDKEDRDLLDNVYKLVGILVGLTVLYAFFRRRGKKVPSDDGGNTVENVKDSAISFGDQCPTIKSDRIEGGVHITYPSPKEPAVAEKPLGKISNIPHPHNPNFTGRVDLLNRLSDALASGERAAFTQTSAITGLGGVGKTQLALEYSYRHADDYQVVWWVRSEEPATLAADYASLAGRLDLPEKGSQDQRVSVEAVRCWLEKNGGWLLVFDNAQDPEELNDYLPRTGKGDVIITSRNPNWGGTAKPLPVDVFSREESVEFLKNRTGQEDGADTLAEALGNLPLALEQAGAYIQETGISLSAYIKLFQERQKELLRRGKPDAYPDTVATTWDLSFQKASEEVPASADLLNLCAFLAPDYIPKSLLTDGVEHLPEPLASAVTDEMALNYAVAALKRYSLMTVADDSLSVHRLVQAVARDRLSEKERKRWAEAAVRLVNGAFPQESDDVRTWALCSVLLPHALAATEHAEGLGLVSKANGRLLNQVGSYLFGRGEFHEAKSAYEQALEIEKMVYGPDHPYVATIVSNLGEIQQKMGDLAGAKKSFEWALEIDEKVYGPHNPNVATDLNNLGVVLKAVGDLASAKKGLERALEIDEKTLNPDHPYVARDLNNLGEVLRYMGDLAGAKSAFEQALKILKKSLGSDFDKHPQVAVTINNLGLVQRSMGDLEGAKEYFDLALKIDKKAFGPDFDKNPEVAVHFANLGILLKDLGDLEGARNNLEKALEICRSRLGENHPKTMWARKNLESLQR